MTKQIMDFKVKNILNIIKYFLLLIIFIIPSLCSATNNTYKNSEHHFSISIPDSWTEIDKSYLDKYFSYVSENTDELWINNIDDNIINNMSYVWGYKLNNDDNNNYPYFLIQGWDKVSLNFPKENELNMIKDEYQKLLKNISDSFIIEDIYLNENINWIIMDIKWSLGQNYFKYKWVLFLWKKEIIHMYFYSNVENFKDDSQAFNEIINSFRFDSGYWYEKKSNVFNELDFKALFWKGFFEWIMFFIIFSLLVSKIRKNTKIKEKKSDDTDDMEINAITKEDNTEIKWLGWWLIVLIIWLILGLVSHTAYILIESIWIINDGSFAYMVNNIEWFFVTAIFRIIFYFIFIAYLVCLIFLFFNKDKLFPLLFKIFLIINIVFILTDEILVRWMYLVSEIDIEDNWVFFTNIISSFFYMIIWGTYINISKRVKNTFTENKISFKKDSPRTILILQVIIWIVALFSTIAWILMF